MKTITTFKLLAIILVFIFIIGPATASKGFDAGKSAILSEYISSSGYSKFISSDYGSIVKPDFSVISNPSMKPNLNLFKNIPLSWDSAFIDQAKQSSPLSMDWDEWFPPNSGGCGCGC